MRRVGDWLLVKAVRRFLDAQGPNWGTVVAWNLFFAFFPMVIMAVTVVGLILQDPGARAVIESQVAAAFPSCADGGQCPILGALNDFRRSTGIFAVLGVLGLVWSGSSLFSAVEMGLNSLYPCRSRSFLAQKLMAAGMVVIFTVMAVPLVLSGTLLSLVQSLPVVPEFFRAGPASLVLQIVAGTVDASLLFGIIYFVVPNRTQRLRQILPGSLVAGALFELFSLVFPVYFKLATRTPQWGQTFSFIFLLLFYFFVIGQIILLGGALNAETEGPATRPLADSGLAPRTAASSS